jgi:hypothetical protein
VSSDPADLACPSTPLVHHRSGFKKLTTINFFESRSATSSRALRQQDGCSERRVLPESATGFALSMFSVQVRRSW